MKTTARLVRGEQGSVNCDDRIAIGMLSKVHCIACTGLNDIVLVCGLPSLPSPLIRQYITPGTIPNPPTPYFSLFEKESSMQAMTPACDP